MMGAMGVEKIKEINGDKNRSLALHLHPLRNKRIHTANFGRQLVVAPRVPASCAHFSRRGVHLDRWRRLGELFQPLYTPRLLAALLRLLKNGGKLRIRR